MDHGGHRDLSWEGGNHVVANLEGAVSLEICRMDHPWGDGKTGRGRGQGTGPDDWGEEVDEDRENQAVRGVPTDVADLRTLGTSSEGWGFGSVLCISLDFYPSLSHARDVVHHRDLCHDPSLPSMREKERPLFDAPLLCSHLQRTKTVTRAEF